MGKIYPKIIFGFLITVLIGIFSWGGWSDPWLGAARIFWAAFVGLTGFLILWTGKISRWRAVLFIAMAWGFMVYFKSESLGLTGKFFTSDQMRESPYCHIAMASSIFNYLYQQYLALKSKAWSAWGPLSLGFLWLIVTLTLGQAWCSWACFYGGLDEGFSRILKKPPLKRFNLPAKIRDMPAAILIFMILISFSAMLPIFCLWVCPLKITTSFLDPIDAARKAQLLIFAVIGILTIIALPLVMGKRTFCGLICPFGAWQALFGQINPFRVTIDQKECSQCGLCAQICPTFAITQDSLKNPRISSYCNRCGVCLDQCPAGAISYTVGPHKNFGPLDAKILFLFSALLVAGAAGALFMPEAIATLARGLFR
ncbi:MAG: 4Fe-4S binding protein [Elusimicrobia bacterium]|nr:4Fe-4S binding protein [Elusimicrobiota bacterium]